MDGSAHVLTSVLQSLQAPADRNTSVRSIVSSSALCLSRLTNPLNVSLLTTQLLAAPALWNAPDLLPICQAVFDIFRLSASERAKEVNRALSLGEWVEAVVNGADARVPRWKHALASGGIVTAFEPMDARLPHTTRSLLETHFVEVVNLQFEFMTSGIESLASLLALSNTFRFLSEEAKFLINYPALVNAILPAMFLSSEGFQTGDFLRQVDRTVPESTKLDRLTIIPSFSLKDFLARPLMTNMGAFARLASTAMSSSPDPEIVSTAINVLATYSRSLSSHWRDSRLSTLDAASVISNDPTQTNNAHLWQILKSSMFSTVVVLESVVNVLLQNRYLSIHHSEIPLFASQILCILRDLYFITHKTNPAAFAIYNFVYHACIDIVISTPTQAVNLASQLKPTNIGIIPDNPTERLQDLYFLNLMEHLVIACPPTFCTSIISPSITPYLTAQVAGDLREPFEAAHSLTLAMIGAPQLVDSSYDILPKYIESLFAAYPAFLSTRQFRLALSTLIKFTSPPTALSGRQRDLPDIILEMLSARIQASDPVALVQAHRPEEEAVVGAAIEPFSERDACVLAMLDSLPFMEERILERWLEVSADFVAKAVKAESREVLRGRFWDVISGELDVGRAQLAIPWWSEGGRETLLGWAT